ncbi:MAG: hypothetical protein GY737_10985, partial [Desulfobacteraceae bacterium]|nr:hypothetical protein [Desulfobacteraceae bacterium]
ICPNMSKADGIIVGCHALIRLGFTLCGPDGIDYLWGSDLDDNMEICKSTPFPAPGAVPSSSEGEGETSEEVSAQLEDWSRKAQQKTNTPPPKKKKKGRQKPKFRGRAKVVEAVETIEVSSETDEAASADEVVPADEEPVLMTGDVDGGEDDASSKEICFACSSAKDQFVLFESASKVRLKVDLGSSHPPKGKKGQGKAYLF